MSFECLQEVANDHEELFESGEDYDVIIYAGENETVKEIHAHSLILRTRSQYFRAALSKEWSEKKDGKFIFKKPNISPHLFKIILRFIYCGRINLEKLQAQDVLKLLIAVDEINIQTLTNYIQEYLIKLQDELLQQNPGEILETIYQHETFTDLWNFCLERICAKPDILFKTDNLINLKAPLLELLLRRDDLLLNEIDIWDSLIKWSFAQHPSIQQDIKKWNKEDITIMERTIHRFIPLIRFYHISSEDFLLKIYPFKVLLPKDLMDNIFKIHMTPDKKPNLDMQPPRQPKCDSTLIKAEHFAIISSWIEKKNNFHYNARNIPYSFNLLYRASRDGNTGAEFHARCDNKGATVVVVKIENSKQIVGGYNPLFWDSSTYWKSTNDSFIFSFANRDDLQTTKVGYSNGNEYSVRGYPNYGPIFGYGSDLYSDSCWHGGGDGYCSSYPKVDIPENFNADDYEVFQVIKR
ncbi:hypothetical protein C1645_881501 [Glomus cerebriforme]|uniref:BTB/POZ domain-containing protein n=1 Tax=Glomus cerebriforme TaxID=658196 RepID=A0A397S5H2_9GLOM|nr:hypothetical protein C1645_881501 [Glomus cerebriforme]